MHVPSSSYDFKQLTKDLGKFADSPDQYVELFQNLPQIFELDRKDVMLILNQALTSTEQNAALQATETFGDEHVMAYGERAGVGEDALPSGKQAVPLEDPGWDYDSSPRVWKQKHFQMYSGRAMKD